VATAVVGVFAVGIVIDAEDDDGGGGGGIVEFKETSILFVDTTLGTGDVAEILSLGVVGGDDTPVPLTVKTDVLSDFIVGIASEFDDGDSGCSTISGSGGGSGGSSS